MIRDFSPDDLDVLNPLDIYSREENTKEHILNFYNSPDVICKSLLAVHDELLAVLGGIVNAHTLTLFAYVDKNVEKYPIQYHRTSERFFLDVVKQLGIKRVQSVIFADNKKALAQHFLWGFQVEGYMRCSSPLGEDELLLARIF